MQCDEINISRTMEIKCKNKLPISTTHKNIQTLDVIEINHLHHVTQDRKQLKQFYRHLLEIQDL